MKVPAADLGPILTPAFSYSPIRFRPKPMEQRAAPP